MGTRDLGTEALKAVLPRARELWLGRPGVVGVDLGYRTRGGEPTRDLVLRVHVRKKKPESDLSRGEVFPRLFEGVEVDVVEATYGEQISVRGRGNG